MLRIVVGIAIEQEFEIYLEELGIDFDTTGRTHWRKNDHAEFIIGDAHVDIKGYHVYPSAGRQFPAWFLDVEGLVPVDQISRATAANIYIQAFLVSPQYNYSDTHLFIALPPRSWANRWREARAVIISLEDSDGPALIGLHGESADMIGQRPDIKGDVQENVLVSAGEHVKSQIAFSSLQYISCENQISGTLRIEIEQDGSFAISSNDWYDLWLDASTIYYTAWGTGADYRSGVMLPPQTKTRLYTGGTRTANFSRLVRDLRPLSQLLR